MQFNALTEKHIQRLKQLVAEDRFSTGDSNLDLHSKDQSRHPACRPEAVIWPVNKKEVSSILVYANRHRLPVTAWGAGSSLEGNPIPIFKGLVLDFTLMNHILEIRESDFQADVEPGVIYQDLNSSLKHKGLFFPPDPGARATIGGMIANNASGLRTVRYGSTRENVLLLKVALANGDLIEIGSRSAKVSSGYDLKNLFVGSEGTLGIIVQATVRLRGRPEESMVAIASFPAVEIAARSVFEIVRSDLDPATLEIMDHNCIKLINKESNLSLEETPTLFVEFHGAVKTQVEQTIDMTREICNDFNCLDFMSGVQRSERNILVKARYELAENIRRSAPDRTHVVLDAAVPISAFPRIISFARRESSGSGIPVYIFGHAGDGNLHLAFMGKTGDKKEWAIIDRINERVVEMAIALGGTATGEHGVGLGKRKFMNQEHGESLAWMLRIKTLFDPNGILNPGKIF
jgi:D-lactate dehydrogenase (cytochrome)